MKFTLRYDGKLYTYEVVDYLDPQIYEYSETDPLEEREQARINRIVWGKPIPPTPKVIEGTVVRKS